MPYGFANRIHIVAQRANGCTLAGHYGVQCICDYLPNERKFGAEYFNALEQLEHNLTATYPYYLLARFYQVIMQKTV
jgi:hypothetical protein